MATPPCLCTEDPQPRAPSPSIHQGVAQLSPLAQGLTSTPVPLASLSCIPMPVALDQCIFISVSPSAGMSSSYGFQILAQDLVPSGGPLDG